MAAKVDMVHVTGRKQRNYGVMGAALQEIGRTAATVGFICAIVLSLFQGHAEAVLYCYSSCQEVSGWKSVVTQVQDAGEWNNAGGVCSYADWPKFRAGTLYVEYTDSTCQGQVLRNGFYWVCVDNYPKPSVGYQTGPAEIPYNGNDEDCNLATPDDDLDGDGYLKANECNDNDATIYPGAKEICDGKDNNCNGIVDDECEGGEKQKGNLGAPENKCMTCPCP